MCLLPGSLNQVMERTRSTHSEANVKDICTAIVCLHDSVRTSPVVASLFASCFSPHNLLIILACLVSDFCAEK